MSDVLQSLFELAPAGEWGAGLSVQPFPSTDGKLIGHRPNGGAASAASPVAAAPSRMGGAAELSSHGRRCAAGVG